MATTGRGRGRGLLSKKHWLGNFKPKPCLVKKEDILALGGDFGNADEDFTDSTQSIDELSDKLAGDILSDEKEEVSVSEFDEKPSIQNYESATDQCDEKLPKLDISSEGNSKITASTDLLPVSDEKALRSNLAHTVHAKEFIPAFLKQSEEKSQQVDYEDEKTVVLNVLMDAMMMMVDDPALIHDNLSQLSEHLQNFVTNEETLKAVIGVLFQQGLTEQSHAYIIAKICQNLDESKSLELEDGTTFRKLFFKMCQEEFNKIKLELNNNLGDRDKSLISNTSLLFGELYCHMKLKGKPNPLFKSTVFKLVEMLLDSGDAELLTTLTKLLKLVGPELDVDRPRDVEEMFNKVRDFYLDKKKTEQLPVSVKDGIWRVYKLHSRDWDRRSSQPSTPTSLQYSPRFPDQDPVTNFPVPVDWDEYYAGDDSDLYKSYFDTSDGLDEDQYDDAYEEFLKISGQV